jgi:hypothetical protein
MSHRHALIVIAVIGVVLIGYSLSVDYPRTAGTMWSDVATYYTMAHSLAQDQDLVFTRHDLERVVREYPGGPSGIFLKRGREIDLTRFTLSTKFPFLHNEGDFTEEIYYAKAYLYSLFAAPWVFLFGTNGMLVLHALAVMVVLVCGYFFLTARSSPAVALAYTLTFFFASVAPAYYFWLTPELFNLALVFLGAFFWLYKERATEPSRLLRGANSDLIAAVIWGAVTYSKPSNVFLIVPLVLLLVLRRNWRRGLVVGTVFGVVLGGLFFVNLLVTGEMNYQGGDRKTFLGKYPYQKADLTFENTGLAKVTSEIYTQQPWDIVFHDLYFFHIGRFSGMFVYFFPALVSVLLFVFSPKERWQWFLLGVATFECLLLIVWMPVNYFGGGGTLGNRYFMNIYPLYFFLIPVIARPVPSLASSWAVAGVFLTTILVDPYTAARNPGEHATSGAFKWLPVELSLINDLPTNSDRRKFRQRFEDGYLGYFLDNNTWGKERHRGVGFWVKGGTRAEMVVRTGIPVDKLVVRVLNTGVPNRIEVCVPGGCIEETYEPGQKKMLELPAGRAFPYENFGARSYCYVVTFAPERGEIPFLARRGETDRRYLGAFIHIEPEPYPALE